MSKSAPTTRQELRQKILDRVVMPEHASLTTATDAALLDEISKADRRAKMPEKQITLAGLTVVEEVIAYDVAKSKVHDLREELKVVAADMNREADPKAQALLEAEYV
mmetsp:Transcript_28504/g.80309  ORF Transcript_28504/g.80309 Transcript_28504/m.80309 type:complete len:107 (-) Transcript_28504:625-945(-)